MCGVSRFRTAESVLMVNEGVSDSTVVGEVVRAAALSTSLLGKASSTLRDTVAWLRASFANDVRTIAACVGGRLALSAPREVTLGDVVRATAATARILDFGLGHDTWSGTLPESMVKAATIETRKALATRGTFLVGGFVAKLMTGAALFAMSRLEGNCVDRVDILSEAVLRENVLSSRAREH